MPRMILPMVFVALLSLALAGCPIEAEQEAAETASAVASADRAEFDRYYAAWEVHREEVSYSSNSEDYTSGPAFEAIVGMGKRSLPLVMEKIAAGNFHMNRAARLITGVNVAPRSSVDLGKWPPMGEQGISKRWLAWWEEHRDDPEWQR